MMMFALLGWLRGSASLSQESIRFATKVRNPPQTERINRARSIWKLAEQHRRWREHEGARTFRNDRKETITTKQRTAYLSHKNCTL